MPMLENRVTADSASAPKVNSPIWSGVSSRAMATYRSRTPPRDDVLDGGPQPAAGRPAFELGRRRFRTPVTTQSATGN
jgi:hypothetical protein